MKKIFSRKSIFLFLSSSFHDESFQRQVRGRHRYKIYTGWDTSRLLSLATDNKVDIKTRERKRTKKKYKLHRCIAAICNNRILRSLGLRRYCREMQFKDVHLWQECFSFFTQEKIDLDEKKRNDTISYETQLYCLNKTSTRSLWKRRNKSLNYGVIKNLQESISEVLSRSYFNYPQ